MTKQKKPRPIPIEVRETERGRAGLYLVEDIAEVVRGVQRETQADAWYGWIGYPPFVKSWGLRPGCFAVALEDDVDAVFGPLPFRQSVDTTPPERLTSKHEQPSTMIPREPVTRPHELQPKLSTKELERLARGENPHILMGRSAVASAPAFKFERVNIGWDPEGLG